VAGGQIAIIDITFCVLPSEVSYVTPWKVAISEAVKLVSSLATTAPAGCQWCVGNGGKKRSRSDDFLATSGLEMGDPAPGAPVVG
jgi:hypothetical protein